MTDKSFRYDDLIKKTEVYMRVAAEKLATNISATVIRHRSKIMELKFAEEFSRYPYGRSDDDGKHNGAKFREELLKIKFEAARQKNETLEIVLDDVRLAGGSFLDEAFGEFAKELKENKGITITKRELSFRGNLPHYKIYIDKIWQYINKHYSADNHSHAA